MPRNQEIELRQLRYFVMTAEELHFGRAAARLQVAQPSLTRQIQLLEQQLGVTLFSRTQRQVQLTAAGQVLLAQTRLLLSQYEGALTLTRQATQSSRLTFGIECCAASHGLPQVLQEFNRRYPSIHLVSHQLNAPEQEEALRQGKIDVGFLHPPLTDRQLVFEQVMEETFIAVLPATHPLARRRALPLKELANDPFILYPRELAPACFDIVLNLCKTAGFTPKIVHETTDFNFCLTLIASGTGVTLAPSSARERRRTGVVYRPLNEESPRVAAGFARRAGSMPPALEQLLTLWRTGLKSPIDR